MRRGGGACGRKCADVPACCGQVLQWFTAKLRSVTGESEAEEDEAIMRAGLPVMRAVAGAGTRRGADDDDDFLDDYDII